MKTLFSDALSEGGISLAGVATFDGGIEALKAADAAHTSMILTLVDTDGTPYGDVELYVVGTNDSVFELVSFNKHDDYIVQLTHSEDVWHFTAKHQTFLDEMSLDRRVSGTVPDITGEALRVALQKNAKYIFGTLVGSDGHNYGQRLLEHIVQKSEKIFVCIDEESDADITFTITENDSISFAATPPVSLSNELQKIKRVSGLVMNLSEDELLEAVEESGDGTATCRLVTPAGRGHGWFSISGLEKMGEKTYTGTISTWKKEDTSILIVVTDTGTISFESSFIQNYIQN